MRRITGVIQLKRMFKESDESVADRWKENPYWQYFCGEVHFQHHWPFDPTELIKFRQRLGEKGMERILSQQQKDHNKTYSLHEPEVRCIAKGKEAKKYEFGNKSSIAKTLKPGISVGALAFRDNPYDADTLDPRLRRIEKTTGRLPKIAILDRGYKGKKTFWVLR